MSKAKFDLKKPEDAQSVDLPKLVAPSLVSWLLSLIVTPALVKVRAMQKEMAH